MTQPLGASAAATFTLEANQGVDTSASKTISGTGGTRFNFSGFGLGGSVEDIRACIAFSNGDTTNPVKVRNIQVRGHYTES